MTMNWHDMHDTPHLFRAAFSFSCDIPSEMLNFFPFPPRSHSHHIFIESLLGFRKAEKEIMMVPLRTVLRAKLLYIFSILLHPDFPPDLTVSFFSLSDISICKHLRTFPSHAVSFSQQMLQMKTQTLCYQMWALGAGSLGFTNRNADIISRVKEFEGYHI